ncbi:MAG TPA: TIGR03984 family CRISPR-associated protein [Anaerolineae bacterium]|nr:TIGR03984 family CRISPR-associated protein [Anaerolineae bacterium]
MTVKLCPKPVYEIQTGSTTRKLLSVSDDVWSWLEEEAAGYDLSRCLGHTLDGVFWGQLVGGKLRIALTEGDCFAPLNQAAFFDLLCELRLFGDTAELHLWRQNDVWQASLIQDDAGESCEFIDESQMLWGTRVEAARERFTLLSDGVQGLYHAVPLPPEEAPVAENGKYRPLRLRVRHYLAEDANTGQMRIAYSRLLAVTAVAQEETDGF